MNKMLISVLFLGLFVSVRAQNPIWPDDTQSASLRYAMVGLKQDDPTQLSPYSAADTLHLKKPGRAALFSAVIPGTGELYGGSWLKGAILLTAEIGLWIGYARFYQEGADWRDQFHDYAYAHWSEDDYWISIAHQALGDHPELQAVIDGTESYTAYLEVLRAWEQENHHHTLPEERNQQYFEVIGKYDLFVGGWDDYNGQSDKLTPHRNAYETMRHTSNVEFKRASTCAMVSLANHLISSLDAAWTVARQNRKIRASMHVDLKPIRNEMVPLYGFQVEW